MKHLYWWRFLSSLLVLALVSCNSAGTPPQISNLNPLTLDLAGKTSSGVVGQFSFSNSGGSDLVYQITEDAPWFTITDGASGSVKPSGNQTIKASASCPATPATLSTSLKITATGLSTSKDLVVNLVCSAPDTTPDSFSFATINNAEPNSDVVSNEVTITGIDSPILVSASNGATIFINNIAASTINNNDKLKIGLKSGPFGSTVATTVKVGSASSSFIVTTKPEPKLSLGFNPNSLALKQGESKTSNAAIAREGFAGAVAVTASASNGVTADALTIASDQNSGMVKINAASNAKIGQFELPLSATGGGQSASSTITVTITGTSTTPITSGGYQPIFTLVGKAIATQTPTIMGGTTPYSLSIDAALPAGLLFDPSSGSISGIPSVAASLKTYTITIKDSSNPVQSLQKTVAVTVDPMLSVKGSYSNVNGTIGFATKKPGQVLVEGGIPPYSYSIAPSLPAGLILNPNSGQIGGIPTVLAAQKSYTVMMKDSEGTTVTTNAKVTVNAVPVFFKGYQSLINEIGDAEKLPQTPEFSGGAFPVAFSIFPSLTDKTGIVFDPSTGIISGPPTKLALEEKYAVTVTDENGASHETRFRVLIIPRFPPKVINTSVKEGEVVKIDLKELKVDFNKNINATSGSMSLVCSYQEGGKTVNKVIAFDGLPIVKSSTTTLLLKTILPIDAICTLTVFKNEVEDLPQPPLNMENDFVLRFKTDAAPDVISFETIPDGGALANGRVGTNVNIKVVFTELVNVVTNGMTLVCGVTNITFSGLPFVNSNSVIIDPTNDLPQDSQCLLTVLKDQVSDSDTADAPDHMNQNRVFSFKTDAAPDAISIETTPSSDPAQSDRVSVGTNIKVNFSEAVGVLTNGMTLLCGNTNIVFSGLPTSNGSNSSSATIDPSNDLPQDSDCVLTVLKDSVSDSDSADVPDHMNQNRVFNFKTEALNGLIDLQLAFDPALISYEGAPNAANPNKRNLLTGVVNISGKSFPTGQDFFSSQLIPQVLGSTTGLDYDFIASDIVDAVGNVYKAYLVKDPNFGGFPDCTTPNAFGNSDTYQVKNNQTTVVKVIYCDPTVVRNTSDATAGSLRAVVAGVQPGSTVTFLNSLSGQVITLTSGEIVIDKDISIFGLGQDVLTVRPDNINTAAIGGIQPQVDVDFPGPVNKRIFHIKNSNSNTSATVVIQSLTLQDGLVQKYSDVPNPNPTGGGCILADADTTKLTLNNLAFNRCWVAGSLYSGGAVLFEPNASNAADNNFTLNNVMATNNCAAGNSLTSFVCGPKFGVKATAPIQAQANGGREIPSGGVGGVITSNNAALLVKSGHYTNNHANQSGGAIMAIAPNDDTGKVWIKLQDATLSNNIAADGGAMYAIGSVNLSNNAFTDNTALNSGGAIYSYTDQPNQSVVFENNTISNNASSLTGGAAYINIESSSLAFIALKNTVANNTSGGNGGGFSVYINGGTSNFDFANNYIHGNISQANGGGAYLVTSILTTANVNFSKNTIYDNHADNLETSGGGVYANVYAGSMNFINNTISSNTSYNAGGIFAASTLTSNIMKFNTVYNNKAQSSNGGIYINPAPTQLNNLIVDNFKGNPANVLSNTNDDAVFANGVIGALSSFGSLQPMAANGGQATGRNSADALLTHLPGGSFIIGVAQCDPDIATDQRGFVRNTANLAACDHGAVETP
jgi:hypothetical protein